MSAGARALLGLIGFYRRGISPLLGPRCRFTPTCSEYAQEAVQVHGAARGLGLAVVRIAKCAPWHRGGVDLVPPRPPARSGTAQLIHSSDTGTPSPDPAPPSEARVA
ncbi:membrane protein insertion efficiency factor YidD [Klenkia sp. LSe6-5]|uniref:Putative membrane protein insertion efficiency factor n=1 Tax=Klenkia sesuvii TaxID=3103137 RepID=A0ABU8DS24_9ACTN